MSRKCSWDTVVVSGGKTEGWTGFGDTNGFWGRAKKVGLCDWAPRDGKSRLSGAGGHVPLLLRKSIIFLHLHDSRYALITHASWVFRCTQRTARDFWR